MFDNKNEFEKSKCPKNPKVEVIWKLDTHFWKGGIVCSYSNELSCDKCIKKGKYPKK